MFKISSGLLKLPILFLLAASSFGYLSPDKTDTDNYNPDVDPNETFYIGMGPSYNFSRYNSLVDFFRTYTFEKISGVPNLNTAPFSLKTNKLNKKKQNTLGFNVKIGYTRNSYNQNYLLSLEYYLNYLNNYKSLRAPASGSLIAAISFINSLNAGATITMLDSNSPVIYLVDESSFDMGISILPGIKILSSIFYQLNIFTNIGLGMKVFASKHPKFNNVSAGFLGASQSFQKLIFGYNLGLVSQLQIQENTFIRAEYLYAKYNNFSKNSKIINVSNKIKLRYTFGNQPPAFPTYKITRNGGEFIKYNNFHSHYLKLSIIKAFKLYN